MRTTNQIICAVKDNEPVTHEELRLALLALNGIQYFYKKCLDDLVAVVEGGKPKVLVDIRVAAAKDINERMFAAIKTDPEVWLGPQNIPGNKEHDDRLAWGKKLFEKATGETL